MHLPRLRRGIVSIASQKKFELCLFLHVRASSGGLFSGDACSFRIERDDYVNNQVAAAQRELGSEFQLGFQLPCLAANEFWKLPAKLFCWTSVLEMWQLISDLMKMTSFVLPIRNFWGPHLVLLLTPSF